MVNIFTLFNLGLSLLMSDLLSLTLIVTWDVYALALHVCRR